MEAIKEQKLVALYMDLTGAAENQARSALMYLDIVQGEADDPPYDFVGRKKYSENPEPAPQ